MATTMWRHRVNVDASDESRQTRFGSNTKIDARWREVEKRKMGDIRKERDRMDSLRQNHSELASQHTHRR